MLFYLIQYSIYKKHFFIFELNHSIESINMDINALLIFHKIAQNNSFSETSRVLEIPISTVSRKINKLEEDFKRKLFLRSTRQIKLTQDGQALYESSKHLFNSLSDLTNLFQEDSNIQGDIRVTSTIEHKNYLAPKIVEFRQLYPNINLYINFSNEKKELISGGYNFAFTAGVLKDSSLYSYHLYKDQVSAYIHRDYFPSKVDEASLREFDFCVMEAIPTIEFASGQTLKPQKKIMTNSIEFIFNYAAQQPTIIYVPESHVTEDFIKINLFKTRETNFQIVYLDKKMNRACELFLEFFKQHKNKSVYVQ